MFASIDRVNTNKPNEEDFEGHTPSSPLSVTEECSSSGESTLPPPADSKPYFTSSPNVVTDFTPDLPEETSEKVRKRYRVTFSNDFSEEPDIESETSSQFDNIDKSPETSARLSAVCSDSVEEGVLFLSRKIFPIFF